MTEAEQALRQMSYYRITGYAFQFLNVNGRYRKGTSFKVVIALHNFDQKLRSILLSHLEKVELYVRTQIAYEFSLAHGSSGHYDVQNFREPKYHAEFLIALSDAIRKNEGAPFVYHHQIKYGGRMPLWCASEILSFSTISKLYRNMLPADQAIIAKTMNVAPDYMINWLHCLSVLRNICAHYGRIYNNRMSPPIKLGGKTLRKHPDLKSDTILAYIVIMLRVLPRTVDRSRLSKEITELMDECDSVLELGLLGFPASWRTFFK